MKFRCCKCR